MTFTFWHERLATYGPIPKASNSSARMLANVAIWSLSIPMIATLYISLNGIEPLRGINTNPIMVAISLYLTLQSLSLVYASRKFPEAIEKLQQTIDMPTEEFKNFSERAQRLFFHPSLRLLAVLILLSLTGTYSVATSRLYQGDIVLTILLTIVLAYAGALNWIGVWSLYTFLHVSSSLGKTFRLRVNPFHPDRSGGLSPIAELSTLAMFLVGIYAAISVPVWYLVSPFNALGLAIVTSVIVPIIFFYSMSGIYVSLRNEKTKMLTEMADELQLVGNQVRTYLSRDHSKTSSMEELIRDTSMVEAMQGIYASVSRMRTFPINNEMLLKLASTMLSPIAALVATQAFLSLTGYLP